MPLTQQDAKEGDKDLYINMKVKSSLFQYLTIKTTLN